MSLTSQWQFWLVLQLGNRRKSVIDRSMTVLGRITSGELQKKCHWPVNDSFGSYNSWGIAENLSLTGQWQFQIRLSKSVMDQSMTVLACITVGESQKKGHLDLYRNVIDQSMTNILFKWSLESSSFQGFSLVESTKSSLLIGPGPSLWQIKGCSLSFLQYIRIVIDRSMTVSY